MTYTYQYPRPSVTATVMLVTMDNEDHSDVYNGLQVVLGLRGPGDAYPNKWCLPGGFLNARVDPVDVMGASPIVEPGETVEQTACREVLEETGITVTPNQLILFHVHSDPLTDPRAHVVNVCYAAVVTEEEYQAARAGDDLVRLDRVAAREFTALGTQEQVNHRKDNMAFNHYDLVGRGVNFLTETI